MKFLLLCLNVVILLMLGLYFINPFDIKSSEPITFAYLFIAAILIVVIANEFVEKFNFSNPLYFLVPGIFAVVAPFIVGKQIAVAIALGLLLLAPGIVLLLRNIMQKKK